MHWGNPNDESVAAVSGGLYRRIWHLTGRTQLLLAGLSIAVAALAAAPLHFQREIVNGLTYGTSLDEVLALGAQYASVVLLTTVLKFFLQYRSALLGEAMVRRIRRRISSNYSRDRQGGAPSRRAPGTVVSMLTAEAEGVGHFVGEAIAAPLMQIGTLVSVLFYIGASEPMLGLFILAIVAPQVVIVGTVQKSVNDLVRRRLELLRKGADRTVDTDRIWPQETILETFDGVYDARRRIHILKLCSKSTLNALTALGTVGTLVLGGWLVLRGETDVGTVVAALSGLTRIARPWNDLIKFYRTLSTVRVRFELLTEKIG
jgi:ABC-type bacteriocin/lantibiotic exporter with double-glycine peptidase domain